MVMQTNAAAVTVAWLLMSTSCAGNGRLTRGPWLATSRSGELTVEVDSTHSLIERDPIFVRVTLSPNIDSVYKRTLPFESPGWAAVTVEPAHSNCGPYRFCVKKEFDPGSVGSINFQTLGYGKNASAAGPVMGYPWPHGPLCSIGLPSSPVVRVQGWFCNQGELHEGYNQGDGLWGSTVCTAVIYTDTVDIVPQAPPANEVAWREELARCVYIRLFSRSNEPEAHQSCDLLTWLARFDQMTPSHLVDAGRYMAANEIFGRSIGTEQESTCLAYFERIVGSLSPIAREAMQSWDPKRTNRRRAPWEGDCSTL